MVLNGSKKIDGVTIVTSQVEDFKSCIELCEFLQVPDKRSPFTWWNGRDGEDYIFERLDRVLDYENSNDLFCQTKVEHFPKDGSNHAPLILGYGNSVFSFKNFLNFSNSGQIMRDSRRWLELIRIYIFHRIFFLTLKERLNRVRRLLLCRAGKRIEIFFSSSQLGRM